MPRNPNAVIPKRTHHLAYVLYAGASDDEFVVKCEDCDLREGPFTSKPLARAAEREHSKIPKLG